MSNEEEYYRDRNLSVIYNPDEENYCILIESTKGFGTRMSLDQKVLEELAKQDIAYVSEKLAMMHLSNGLSRIDIIRTHTAILETIGRYNKNLEKFRKKEDL